MAHLGTIDTGKFTDHEPTGHRLRYFARDPMPGEETHGAYDGRIWTHSRCDYCRVIHLSRERLPNCTKNVGTNPLDEGEVRHSL